MSNVAERPKKTWSPLGTGKKLHELYELLHAARTPDDRSRVQAAIDARFCAWARTGL